MQRPPEPRSGVGTYNARPSTLREAERAVVAARRRKRKATHGGKELAALRLKDAVTAALMANKAAANARPVAFVVPSVSRPGRTADAGVRND